RWYREYLEQVPTAGNRPEVLARVEVLEQELMKQNRLRRMITTRPDQSHDAAEETVTAESEPPDARAEVKEAAPNDAPAPQGRGLNSRTLAGWISLGTGAALLIGATASGVAAL